VSEKTKQQIINIRKDLEKENSYFIGSNVVKKNYEAKTDKSVSISFVGRVLNEAGLVKSMGKKKRGRSKYMKYPDYTLTKLGKTMMSIDFIGPRYLKGSDNRINFLSCKYIRPEKRGSRELSLLPVPRIHIRQHEKGVFSSLRQPGSAGISFESCPLHLLSDRNL